MKKTPKFSIKFVCAGFGTLLMFGALGTNNANAGESCRFVGPYFSCAEGKREQLGTVVQRFASEATTQTLKNCKARFDEAPDQLQRESFRKSLEVNRRYAKRLDVQDLRRYKRGEISQENYESTKAIYNAAMANYKRGMWLYHSGRWLDENQIKPES